MTSLPECVCVCVSDRVPCHLDWPQIYNRASDGLELLILQPRLFMIGLQIYICHTEFIRCIESRALYILNKHSILPL